MRRPDIAGWSSLVARRAHNPEVVGSNPAPATKTFSSSEVLFSELFFFGYIARRASCCAGILIPRVNLCALEVVGSNPASTIKTPGQTQESLAARINEKYHHAEMIGMMVHLGSDLERYL